MKDIEHHEYIIKDLINFIGEDPNREGLLETPKRVLKAWKEWTKGYKIDIPSLFKVFEDGANNYDEMVLLKEIPFHSFCEHHMASITGVCSVAYIPNGKIVGLSKIARLVEAYACRLQVQERMTVQIADAIEENLHPKGVGVIITANHQCMSSRGIKSHGVDTITSAMRGVFLEKENNARIEFLNLIKK
jgi:GTP cyclohydrolase I